jgi:hypothetical protein
VQAAARALLDPRNRGPGGGRSAKMDCPFKRYADKFGVTLQEIPLEKIP